jgi:hypothetical protein
MCGTCDLGKEINKLRHNYEEPTNCNGICFSYLSNVVQIGGEINEPKWEVT